MPRPVALLAALIAGVLVLYTANLGHAPIYLHEAEALFALHAHSIATTLHDSNGRLLPLYFQMPEIGENVWFQPMIVYAMAPFLAVLPLSEIAIRLPSVLVGLADVVLIYFIAARIFRSDRWGLLAAVLLALTPSHFIHSRLALDYLYPVPFVLGWLLCLLIFLDQKAQRPRLLFAATSCLGVGLYSYLASVVMMPIYLVMTLIAIGVTVKRPARLWMIAVAGFAWPLVLMLWTIRHPQVLAETFSRYNSQEVMAPLTASAPLIQSLERLARTVRITTLTGRVSLFWSYFDPAYLFLTGGYANVANSTRHVGVFPVSFIVLIPAGLGALALRRRSVVDALLVAAFVSAPLAACLVPEPYAVDRELELLPFGVLAAVAGAHLLMTASGPRWRTAGICLVAAVIPNFVLFSVDYYVDYPRTAAFWFSWNRRGAIEDVLARERQRSPPAIFLSTHHISYVDAYWRLYLIKHRRQDLLARTVYFDSDAYDVRRIPAGSLLLVGPDDHALTPSLDAGRLQMLAAIPEPGHPPFFSVLLRTTVDADGDSR
jgi:4-amino-4-deoxy-L-arabinose transferase-like glycosyltransferase